MSPGVWFRIDYELQDMAIGAYVLWERQVRVRLRRTLQLLLFARRDAFTVEARTKAQWIAATGAHGIVCLRITINRRATIGVASARRRCVEKGK